MGHVIRAEWIRGIRSWRLWVAVGATVVLLLFTALQYARPWYHPVTPYLVNWFTTSEMALGGWPTALWPVLIPVVAALPAGDSLAIDRRRGLDAVAITRVGWTRYLWGKLLGNALMTVTAMGIAIGIVEILFAATLPRVLPRLLGWTYNPALPYRVKISGVYGFSYATQFHPHFFWAAPALYVALVIGVALWAAVSLASLSTAAAVWVRQPLLTLAVPMVVLILGDVVSQALWRSYWVPSVYAGQYLTWVPSVGSWATLALYWVVPLAASGLVLAWMITRRKEWPRSVS